MTEPLYLLGGAYSAANLIANAQRCVNVYPESNPQENQAPVPVTHLLSPGLQTLCVFPDAGQIVRGVYTASNGNLYAAVGSSLYFIDSSWAYHKLATMIPGSNRVTFTDNGVQLLVGDGTQVGYLVTLSNNFTQGITPANNSGTNGFAYYGADYVDYMDTYLVGNQPGTSFWFASNSQGVLFDPLSYGQKIGGADPIVGLACVQRYVWLIGSMTSEIWYDAGGANFPFALVQGPFIEHGCLAKYSITKAGEACFWLGQDKRGRCVALKGEGYKATRISTYAIETEWQKYSTVSDAVGFSFQLGGHTFVCWRFPTADKTWIYDMATNAWHERTTLDNNGFERQWRVNCATEAYGVVVGGDTNPFLTQPSLFQITSASTTDLTVPILRRRSWPHVVKNLKRVRHMQFVADVDVGEPSTISAAPPLLLLADTGAGGTTPLLGDTGSGGTIPLYLDPYVICGTQYSANTMQLRYSNTRGHTWENPVSKSLGGIGQFKTNVQWRRLGIARDRVYELTWSGPFVTALNGAYLAPQEAKT